MLAMEITDVSDNVVMRIRDNIHKVPSIKHVIYKVINK